MPHKPFPRTLRAQWLGIRLRALREERGLTLSMVGEMLNRDPSAISRYERAEWPIQRTEAEALLNIYGFYSAAKRAEILTVVEDLWSTNKWDGDESKIDKAPFLTLPWLESRAECICSYHAALVPGLFQLPEYAEQVIRCIEGPEASETAIARFITMRLERQRILDAPDPAMMETIIDELALRRQIGGPALLRRQLAHLRSIAERPKVEIRVLPTHVWLHPGLEGSFWVFRMPHRYPPVAYHENRAGRIFVESPKSNGFLAAYDRLKTAALDPIESVKLITTIEEELS